MNILLIIVAAILTVVNVLLIIALMFERRENKQLTDRAMKVVELLARVQSMVESQQNMPLMLSLILDRVTYLHNKTYGDTIKEEESGTGSARS